MKNLLILTLAAIGTIEFARAQTFTVYIGAPDDVTTPHTADGAVTETFNTDNGWPSTGIQTSTVNSPGLTTYGGVYNFTGSTGAIVNADQYGGAGGTGQYVAMGNYWTGNDNPYTLTLATPANYFGFWWSAGDQNNYIEFFRNGHLVATFTSANVFSILSDNPTITNNNGDIYATNEYFGNPYTGQNGSEPYAYVSIYSSGVSFDEIRFDNGTLTSTGFESDNHSLYYGTLTPTGTQVFVADIPAIPEPGTIALAGLAATALLIFRRRRLTA